MVLGGYYIPAGSKVLYNNLLISNDPEYFPEPELFKPDRWIRDKDSKVLLIQYVYQGYIEHVKW